MKKLLVSALMLMLSVLSINAQNMIIATYNIRLLTESDYESGNGWNQRYPYIVKLIRFHQFDIFGTEEGFLSQLNDMKAQLPGFDFIGVGRDDGAEKGEHAAIFYDTNKFDVLDHGDFWLSEITDRPNVGWDAALPRVCTWGKFREKSTGFTFMYYNLHMDHIGVVARAESAKLILRKVQEDEDREGLPSVLSGDFNVDQRDSGYLLLANSGLMRDAYEVADFVYDNVGTWNDFHPDRMDDARIDHIFLTKEFHVKRYGILTDTYRGKIDKTERTEPFMEGPNTEDSKKFTARVPSDHFPVMIEVEVVK